MDTAKLTAAETRPVVTHKILGRPGRYSVMVGRDDDIQHWIVWRGLNGRWYGESKDVPRRMVDAATLRGAKLDIKNGHFVACASAGCEDDATQRAWETAMGLRGYAGSAAEREARAAIASATGEG